MKKYNSFKVVAPTAKIKELSSPTNKDIKDTIKIFKDFDISTNIPEFKTRSELYNWRDRVIRGALK